MATHSISFSSLYVYERADSTHQSYHSYLFVGMHHQQGKAQPIDSTSLIDEHKRTTSISRKSNKSPSQGNTPIPTKKKKQPSNKRSSNYQKKQSTKNGPVFRKHCIYKYTHHNFYRFFLCILCPKFHPNRN